MSHDRTWLTKLVDLSVSLEGNAILKGVNLELHRGHRYAVMGPSGSGKSTFLKVLVGLTNADGQSQFERHRDLKAIAYLPQDSKDVVVPWYRVGRHCPAEDLKALDLFPLRRKWPRDLSGGELRRLAIARVLNRHTSCDLVAMDEPLTGLDVDIRAKAIQFIVGKLNSLTPPGGGSGPLFVFVTHYKEEAAALATRKLEIDKHNIREREMP
jgi:NitT/TauT family transport system ATP-binding protein